MNINILFQYSLEQKFGEIKAFLDKTLKTSEINAQSVSEIVYTMDEIQHSLIFLYFGDAILVRGINPVLLKKFENFLQNFKRDQVMLNVKKLCSISQKYIDVMIANKVGIKAIKIILASLQRLINGKPEFTAMHEQYAVLCLKTKMYKASLMVIDLPVFSFSRDYSYILKQFVKY